MKPGEVETLQEWLDAWEAEVESGQTRITRVEAIERYTQWKQKGWLNDTTNRNKI